MALMPEYALKIFHFISILLLLENICQWFYPISLSLPTEPLIEQTCSFHFRLSFKVMLEASPNTSDPVPQ